MESKVKFIQIANPSHPYDSDKYVKKIQSVLNDPNYAGAIIFGSYEDASGATKNELYANGHKYELGGSGAGNANVFVGTDDVVDGAVEGYSPVEGAIYIYSPNDSAGSEYRTAYYGNGSSWIPFTGNVKAENVIFENGFVFAGDYDSVGNIKLENGRYTISEKMSLADIFSKDSQPTPSRPSYSVGSPINTSVNYYPENIKNVTKVRVGTTIGAIPDAQYAAENTLTATVSGLDYGYSVNGVKSNDKTYRATSTASVSGGYAEKTFTNANDAYVSPTGDEKITLGENIYSASISASWAFENYGINNETPITSITVQPLTSKGNNATETVEINIPSNAKTSQTHNIEKTIYGYYPYYIYYGEGEEANIPISLSSESDTPVNFFLPAGYKIVQVMAPADIVDQNWQSSNTVLQINGDNPAAPLAKKITEDKGDINGVAYKIYTLTTIAPGSEQNCTIIWQ